MLGITELTKGRIIEYRGEPYVVTSSTHVKLGRGGGMQRVKMKNLLSGTVLDVTFRSAEKIDEASIESHPVQYLYKDDDNFFFMDNSSFEQLALNKATVDDAARYIKEGDNYSLQYFKDKPIRLSVPIKIKLKVVEADIGLKGDTATQPTKTVTLETGYKLNVPLFIKQGDDILVDTRSGEYVQRA